MSTHNGENPDKGTQYDEIISKDYDHNKHLSTQPENMQSKLNESVKPFLTDSNMRVNLKTNRREQPDILFSKQDVNSYSSIAVSTNTKMYIPRRSHMNAISVTNHFSKNLLFCTTSN